MVTFTKRQMAIIIGGMLGDLHIQKNQDSLTGNCRLRFSQNAKQKQYLEWKYTAFEKVFCKNTKGIIPDLRSRKRKVYTSYTFSTERRAEFNPIHTEWYRAKASTSSTGLSYIKTVPPNLDKLLVDPLALAVWYLDDGTKRNDIQSCRIATQSFSKERNEIIQETLLKNFNIRSKIESWPRNKAGEEIYQLAILSSRRGGSYDDFRTLLYPIVSAEVPSMLYKLK